MAPVVTFKPDTPSAGDGVLITVAGEVAEGAKVKVTPDSAADPTAISVPFGIGAIPEGTGPAARTLRILGGGTGDFTLEAYLYGDDDAALHYETDPIYYHNDAPVYAYPDASEVEDALNDVLPQDVSASVSKIGPVLTILFGGRWSGKNVQVLVDPTISGSETVTQGTGTAYGGPFVFGPIQLTEGTYDIDVVDSNGATILNAPIELSIGA